jgi:hypothetical protein
VHDRDQLQPDRAAEVRVGLHDVSQQGTEVVAVIATQSTGESPQQ